MGLLPPGARMSSSVRRIFVAAAFIGAISGPALAQDVEGRDYEVKPDCIPNSFERPYVCDVGAPRVISPRAFRDVIRRNDAIRRHVRRVGYPDLVEIQKVYVDSPWTTEEFRLYYREIDRLFAFSRAYILDLPEVSLMRYQGPIPDDHRQ